MDKRQILIEQLRQKRDADYLEIARLGKLMREYKRTHRFSYWWAKFCATVTFTELLIGHEIAIQNLHWELTGTNATIAELLQQIHIDEMLEAVTS